MQKRFSSERAYLNYQLHALSAVICGDDTVIDEELAARGLISVKELSDAEAKKILIIFKATAKKIGNKKVGITDRQRNLILRIMKHKYNWSDGAMLSYMLETVPQYRSKLSKYELENDKYSHLLNALSVKDADKIIKRLISMEGKNEKRN